MARGRTTESLYLMMLVTLELNICYCTKLRRRATNAVALRRLVSGLLLKSGFEKENLIILFDFLTVATSHLEK